MLKLRSKLFTDVYKKVKFQNSPSNQEVNSLFVLKIFVVKKKLMFFQWKKKSCFHYSSISFHFNSFHSIPLFIPLFLLCLIKANKDKFVFSLRTETTWFLKNFLQKQKKFQKQCQKFKKFATSPTLSEGKVFFRMEAKLKFVA